MSQLGRISGPLLDANLNRLGVDLTFRNYSNSDDLLYLEVTGNKLGVNKTPASHRVEIDGTTKTINLIVDTQAQIDNILIGSNNFSTFTVANITVSPNQTNPLITADHIKAGDLSFKDNVLSNYQVNGSVLLDPNGTGIVDILSSAQINGDLSVTGIFTINGNLTEAANIIVGDTPLDTVQIAPDFSQSIIPGDDILYDLGSVTRRWRNVYTTANANIGSLIYNDIIVSDQMFIESGLPSISTLQSNDDLFLLPDTGITFIERYKFEDNDITNIDSTVGVLANTGIGYLRFVDNNAIIIPAGPDADRNPTPEVGDTRWNTENPTDNYLECFDGTTWSISSGAGGSISAVENYDLANAYILILG
jgi:hypothetical protein